MAKRVISQIKFEIGQIDQLVESYADLLGRSQEKTPDRIECTAIASVLHSFYNGIENIFLSIAKGIDQGVPTGPQWHRDLLIQVAEGTTNRAAVISAELENKLTDYLGFRHFFRHSYSFFLEWGELEKLANPLQEVWNQLKYELHLFLEGLSIV